MWHNQSLCSEPLQKLTTYFREILHSAPTFEGPSCKLNKGEMGELQDEDEEMDKKEQGREENSIADLIGSL